MQLIGGWLLYAIMVGKNLYNSVIIMKETHKYVGNLIYLVAKVNVLLGAYLSFTNGYNTWQDDLIYAFYAFTLTWRVFFEIYFIYQ